MTGWRYTVPAGIGAGAYLVGRLVGDTASFLVVNAASTAVIWVGTRRNWTANALAGRLLAVAAAAWVIGAFLFRVRAADASITGLPWATYAVLGVGYAALIWAIMAVGSRPRRTGVAELLEAGIVSTALGLITWVYLVPAERVGSLTPSVWPLITFAQIDIFCAILVYFLYRQVRLVSPATTPLLVGLLMILFSYYLFNSISVAYPGMFTEVISAIGSAGFAMVALATLEPPLAGPVRPAVVAPRRSGLSVGRVVLISAALAVAPLVMLIEIALDEPVEKWGVAIVMASVMLSALSSGRLFLMLRRLRSSAQALEQSSLTDALTGLGNRRRIDEVLSTLTSPGRFTGTALMVFDIDRFSDINDTFGYTVGDRLLIRVGDRIADTVRRTATGSPATDGPAGEVVLVARLGGDEFAVILDRCTTPTAVVALARAVQVSMSTPIELDDIDLTMDVTVGIAFLGDFPESGATPADVLLQHAHLAATEAKRRQPRLAIYDREMDVDRRDQLRLMSELAVALRTDQLVLHFQPFLDLRTGEAARLECLLRWQHPQLGLLHPDAFLPSAEQTSLMPGITAWVLDAALSQCRQWRRIGLEAVVAVNLSARNLVDPTLPQQVRDALARHRVPASGLVLEVTETSAMLDPARSIGALTELRSIGVSLAIDDYGAGYTSLSYLDVLPVQQLKIDRAFVTGMTHNVVSSAIVASTVDLARSLGLTVVAEGVEDAETLGALRALGCDSAQGYFIGAPVPASDVLPLIGAIATS